MPSETDDDLKNILDFFDLNNQDQNQNQNDLNW